MSILAKPVRFAFDLLERVVLAAAVGLLILIPVVMAWQVLARYVFAESSAWAAELAPYAFVWMSFLAFAVAVRRGRHLLIDVWEFMTLPRWLEAVLDTIAYLFSLGVLVCLVWFGIELLPTAFGRIMPGLSLPYGWVMLAVPVSAGLAIVFGTERWVKKLREAAAGRAIPSEAVDVEGVR